MHRQDIYSLHMEPTFKPRFSFQEQISGPLRTKSSIASARNIQVKLIPGLRVTIRDKICMIVTSTHSLVEFCLYLLADVLQVSHFARWNWNTRLENNLKTKSFYGFLFSVIEKLVACFDLNCMPCLSSKDIHWFLDRLLMISLCE